MKDFGLRNNDDASSRQQNPDPASIVAALARARPMTVEQARTAAPGDAIKIDGRAGAGPQGVLTAPLSGQPCVWYRSWVTPGNNLLRPLPSAAPSDMFIARIDTSWRRRLRISTEISDAPFAVTDGVSQQLIDPRNADVDTDVLAVNRVWRSRRGWRSALLVEWIVPEGAQLLVVGTVGQDHGLTVGTDGVLLVSTKSEPRIVERNRQAQSARGPASADARQRFVSRGNRIVRGGRVVTVGLLGLTLLFILVLVAVAYW